MIMPCCGQKRAQFTTIPGAERSPAFDRAPLAPPTGRPAAPLPLLFEYQGATAATVIGPVTRRVYRFDGPRARVAVDPRDAPSIAALPNLRRVG
jgi:hypothetical protein